MACPVCFFRDDYQKKIKRATFGISRFEEKLKKYKESFIEEVKKINSQENCACAQLYNTEMFAWTNSFLDVLQKATNEINIAFDSIISVYMDYIARNSKIANDNLWSYLTNQNLLLNTESLLTCIKLLFRARPKNGFDIKQPSEYFHIPFSERGKVKSQRFSVSGQPMLYFGSSVLTVAKEMELDLSKLAIAGFIPNYSEFYNSKFYSLKNYINDCIENVLPGAFDGGCKISFFDTQIVPNMTTIINDLHTAILMNICTFPTENKASFIPEYVIPQILTSALLEHDYCGIIFPSTKDFSDLTGHHRFSSHHLNIGVFVPYDDSNNLNISLFNKFTILPSINSVPFSKSLQNIITKKKEIVNKSKQSTTNNNDFIIPICDMDLHLEYLSNSKINGMPYFETEVGKTELDMYYEMLRFIDTKIS